MTSVKRLIYLILGPVICIVASVLLADILTVPGAQAVGTSLWMIFWWIVRPVNITVTAIIPIVANAFFGMVPMTNILSQYAAESIILIIGSGLLTLPWEKIGLDRRIALKALSLIGPSMKSQVVVWLLAATILSNLMPNVAVCAMLTPIAVAMLKAAGYDDIPNCKPAVPILLAIGWGVSTGGAGTPLGGAMNITAISFLEAYTGKEFMYIDWIMRILPFVVIFTIIFLAYMLLMPMEVKRLEGTKEFFREQYAELGPIKRDEKLSLTLFVIALVLIFSRPLYAQYLPTLTPAFIFLVMGFLCFFIKAEDKTPLLTWEVAQEGTLWGMIILFAGGLAMGTMLNGSGASTAIAELVGKMNFDGGIGTIAAFVIFVRVIAEVTNGTTAAAVCLPIIFAVTEGLGLNPLPYWFITCMAFNAEWLLPISVRAIPIAYGLDANQMMKRGIPITIIHTAAVIIIGYLFMTFWPAFSTLSF